MTTTTATAASAPLLEDTTVRSDDDEPQTDRDSEREVGKTTHQKSVKQKAPACPKCRRRGDRARARNEKPPLPKGYGYLTLSSGVDKNGHYFEVRDDRSAYMSCLRCGLEGDHWDPYCPNPINDPPESKEFTAAPCLSWKYILRDFNPKHQIDKEIETQGGIKIERHRIDDNTGRGSFKCPNLEDTIRSDDDLLAVDDKEIETHKRRNQNQTDHHSHSSKHPRIEDSPVCYDDVNEIETQKLTPCHSRKRPLLEDTTVRSDDDDHEQIETQKGEVGKTTHQKSVKQKAPACPKCRRRGDRARARNEKPPLPKGYGYLTLSSGVDKNGHYFEVRDDRSAYMSCLRCGLEGDHWDPYCPNPINDPPESKEFTAAPCLSWKYILRDFNPKSH
ncbi:hypothetical protein M0R45_002539 [Rubus argutus]|uniref:CCHC-type domain-containing protein n=1 Tax=Rubus argutus TaxID=59490 RepID=A0AAW1VR76_RUBAR